MFSLSDLPVYWHRVFPVITSRFIASLLTAAMSNAHAYTSGSDDPGDTSSIRFSPPDQRQNQSHLTGPLGGYIFSATECDDEERSDHRIMVTGATTTGSSDVDGS